MQIDGTTPARGAKVFSGDREIGFVTSAATSPRMGPLALGYVHRDFAEGGTPLEIEAGATRVRAHVNQPSTS
jgi:glycine cleavage system aminomethyltransferase T